MLSIQARLALGLLISVSVLLLAQWLLINRSIHNLSEQYLQSRMHHDADTLVAALNVTAQGIELDPLRLGSIYQKPYSGHYFQVQYSYNDSVNLIRSRSLWDVTLDFIFDLISKRYPSESVSYQKGPDRQDLLVLNLAYTRQGVDFNVLVAEDLTPVNQAIGKFLQLHTWATVSIMLALIIIQFYIVKSGLRPLDRIRRELSQLQAGDSDRISENVPQEILSLVQELNSSLQAMQRKIQRSRHTAGNLAHALKTPLTLLRQIADTEAALSPESGTVLNRHIGELQNIIDSELKRARLAGRVVGGRRFELQPEINALKQTLDRIYHDKSLSIECDVPEDLSSPLEREDLHELLGNLMDNACKWAKSRVLVRVRFDSSHFTISVEDDGTEVAALTPGELNRLLHRGARLDENIAGHGLGLSIVKDVVEAYEGRLTLSVSEGLGGLCVLVDIPLKD